MKKKKNLFYKWHSKIISLTSAYFSTANGETRGRQVRRIWRTKYQPAPLTQQPPLYAQDVRQTYHWQPRLLIGWLEATWPADGQDKYTRRVG